jgi:SAM-dependent methyltransferase
MTHLDRSGANFTDGDWLSHIEALDLPHLNEWMRSQAKRGQDYYLRRLDRIGFSGGTVLDAGCGVGNWTIALAQRFEHVEATDNDAERIGVLSGLVPKLSGSIRASVGSVTKLEFPDSRFDAVFCNGVVFLTDTDAALSEFVRVLRPGGRLYVTYNGPGWWRHLIYERALSEPVCYAYGANGLITWAFRLLGEIDLATVSTTADRENARRALEAGSTDALLKLIRSVLTRAKTGSGSVRRYSDLLACIDDLTTSGVDPSYARRLAIDAGSRLAHNAPNHEVLVNTFTHRPEDMTHALSELGLINIQSAIEGGLCINEFAAPVSPIYRPEQDVFESLARKL